jgi:hypothetical protein
MATETTSETDNPCKKIARDELLRKMLHERYDCRQCPYYKIRGRQLISHCVRHLEELMEELSHAPKQPER